MQNEEEIKINNNQIIEIEKHKLKNNRKVIII